MYKNNGHIAIDNAWPFECKKHKRETTILRNKTNIFKWIHIILEYVEVTSFNLKCCQSYDAKPL